MVQFASGAFRFRSSQTLDGGSLRTGRIAVDPATGSLSLAGGTLTLTGEGAVIDDGADFGRRRVAPPLRR